MKTKCFLTILLVISILILSSCNSIDSNRTTIKMLYTEKDVVIDGHELINIDDLYEWFDDSIISIHKKGDASNNKDTLLGTFLYIFVFDTTYEAHSAFISTIPYTYYFNEMAFCRINNIILYSTSYFKNNEEVRKWKDKFDDLFDINEKDYCEFDTPLKKYKLKKDIEKILSYFNDNEEYLVEDKEYGSINALTKESSIENIEKTYIIKKKDTNYYLTIQKYTTNENINYGKGYDVDMSHYDNMISENDGIGTILYTSTYIIWVPNNVMLNNFIANGWI